MTLALAERELPLTNVEQTREALELALRPRIQGEVRFDLYSRTLYSTDASNYMIDPVGVVLPRTVDDIQAAMEIAAEFGVSILPRGGGSSLAGQAVGQSLIIDTSKYMNQIVEFDADARRVRVQPGMVLATLNSKLKRHGVMFGPDPSSGDRATIGGVVGNNSAGAHSILYGMTKDHIISAQTILSDGTPLSLGELTIDQWKQKASFDTREGRLYRDLLNLRETYGEAIERDYPRHWRRATGYNLPELIREDGFNPARLISSSEGTLTFGVEYEMGLVETPSNTALAVLQFDDLVDAMRATTTILECEPSAIELMDRMLVSLTRSQPGYADLISFISGEARDVIVVEFYGETEEELQAKVDHLESHLKANDIQQDIIKVLDARRQADIWSVRKAGLGLLMSVKGDAKPIACIEDVSVPVEHLAEYVDEILKLVDKYDTKAAFYAHASAGCLHIRPLISLKTLSGIQAMRDITLASADLAVKFGGVMSGEHGDGLARGELNEQIFGPELYRCMKELKQAFDPEGRMNPGKIVDCPPMTENLRYGAEYRTVDIKTHLDFSHEGGFAAAIEMCNGAGVCRKTGSGTMCPSFMATRDEEDSTRGRANALRAALSGSGLKFENFSDPRTYDVLDLCLSCKACKTECPSSVDMAKIKTEFLAQYYDAHGTPARAKMLANVPTLNRLGARLAPLANLVMKTPLASIGKKMAGIHPNRNLAPFVSETFEAWFQKRGPRQEHGHRGLVVYYHDTFANTQYPEIGKATVRLLEAAGFTVAIVPQRACCGRPAYSKGLVKEARAFATQNVKALAPYARQGVPIVGTEPSCILTLRDEYADLLPGDPDVAKLGANSFMIDEFLDKLDKDGDLDIVWKEPDGTNVLFHGHCHQKAVVGMKPSMSMLNRAGYIVKESGAGCCGMAGSFGYEAEHYEVSRKIGEERLFPMVKQQAKETIISVAGVSCREQIGHFTDRRPNHIAEVLAERIDMRATAEKSSQQQPEAIAAD
ncbi:MAG: FAD-binding oxidoreductase [Sphaerobacteraceae bacterium]|nr:MAG: FAD-binding oxidoreductase [Sphaerobacteraceae bacterium]